MSHAFYALSAMKTILTNTPKDRVEFQCPHCSGKMTVDASHLGQRGPCPFCHQSIVAIQSSKPASDFRAHRVIAASDESFANDDSWQKKHQSRSRSRSRRKRWEERGNRLVGSIVEVRGRLVVAGLLILLALGLIAFGFLPHS